MANYETIEELVAGVANATQTRTNSKNDEDTDTLAGVDWFSYDGTVCSSIYANGNSWIGLGASSEHLKVNRRDAAMWNLWREEGTYLGTYKFLRIRWGGCTKYDAYGTPYFITYDVVLFDTGDIMLYMVDVPTGYYNGTFSIGSVEYTAPTTENRYVSFYKQSDGTYTVAYEPISLQQSTITKYLVRDSGKIYTVTDGALVEVSGTLSASLFQTSGIDTIPDGTLLMTLSEPEVLCWTSAEELPTLKATVQGVPVGEHDIVSDIIQIGHESVYGITSVDVTASSEATFLLSFDGGLWMSYTEGKWSASDVGMTTSELVGVPANAWSSMVNSAHEMRLKAILDGIYTVTEVKFNFNNEPVARTYSWQEMKDRFTWSQVANYTWKFFKGVE